MLPASALLLCARSFRIPPPPPMSFLEQLLRHKDIVLYRAKAGIQSEARQNYLGYVWFLAEPVLNTAVLYFAWSHINGAKGFEAILTILIGMVAWGWFESSVMGAAGTIRAKYHVLNQFPLPKWTFPLVTILVNSWKSLFVFLVILALALANGHASLALLWLPLIALIQLTLIVGLAVPIAIAVTLMHDLQAVISSVFRLLFFVSGLFFTAETVRQKSPELLDAFLWNPVAVLIESYRAVIQRGESPDLALLGRAALLAAGCLVVGGLVHRHYDKKILKLTNA